MQNTRLKPDSSVGSLAVDAAKACADAGGSPRAQLDAARKVSSSEIVYKPHIGARQRARELARLAKG